MRIKCKLVSHDFYYIYLRYILSRNNLDLNKYILYRKSNVVGAADILSYDIVKTDKDFIYLKTRRAKKVQKSRKLFNKHGAIYCKFQNNFLYLYEKEFINAIGKDICHNCGNNDLYNYCGIYNKVCDIKNCKKERFYHDKKLKNVFAKEFKLFNFNNWCEHKLCKFCTLKVSIRYNVKKNNYIHKLLIF
jgi:hypothetical protein